MRRHLVIFIVLQHMVTALALPDYPCGENITKRGENLSIDPCVNTSAFSELSSCLDFVSNNRSLPSAECCDSVHNVWLHLPACFCRVTFFEHGFGRNSSARFRARPLLCNLTADLCTLCPTYLFPHQNGKHSLVICERWHLWFLWSAHLGLAASKHLSW